MQHHLPFGRLGAVLIASGLLAACGGDGTREPVVSEVDLRFAAAVNGTEFTCGQTYAGVGSGVNNEFRVNDLRFYLHDVYLVRANGSEQPVALDQDGVWQLDEVALLDFETGCSNGTPETNTRVVGEVQGELSEFTGVCFTLGVPFAKNHIDDATAASPLNASGMLWSWTGGRKFVRIDGVGDPDNLAVGYNVHLGSTGCVDRAGDPAPDAACNFPNLTEFCLGGFDAASSTIVADLGSLLAQADVAVNTTATAPGCMSGNSDPDCINVMPSFGLDFTYSDGVNPPEQHAGQAQSLFSLR